MTHYWNNQTEQAIQQYNNTADDVLRNQIFEEHIYQPLCKLVEVYVQKSAYKSYDREQLQHEIVSHFASQLDKVDTTKGKAFSYFSRSAQFYIWHDCKVISKKENKLQSLEAMINEDGEIKDIPEPTKETMLADDVDTVNQLHQWIDKLDADEVDAKVRKQTNPYNLLLQERRWFYKIGLKQMIHEYLNCEAKPFRMSIYARILAKIIGVESKTIPARESVKPVTNVESISRPVIVKPVKQKNDTYTRICPQCNDTITYKTYPSYYICHRLHNSICNKCKGKNKRLYPNLGLEIKCPMCSKMITYTTYAKAKRAESQNTYCKECTKYKAMFTKMMKYLGIRTTLSIVNDILPFKINVEPKKEWVNPMTVDFRKTYISLDDPKLSIQIN